MPLPGNTVTVNTSEPYTEQEIQQLLKTGDYIPKNHTNKPYNLKDFALAPSVYKRDISKKQQLVMTINTNVNKKYFLLWIIVIMNSCDQKGDNFGYLTDPIQYRNAVRCCYKSYPSMFISNDTLQAEYFIYENELNKFKEYKCIAKLMKKHNLLSIGCYPDSTIEFIQNSDGGILSKQPVLMVANKKDKIIKKLGSNMQIINSKHDEYWYYEIVRNIGLAN